MTRYAIKYFFDPGSGICFWSKNDAARDKWGYPIETSLLPLPTHLYDAANNLNAWYDTSIDWNYPPDPSPWSDSERQRFSTVAQDFLREVRAALGSDFAIFDESNTSDTS